MTPLGAEWGLVTVTEDLMGLARDLSELAWQFGQEARSWTLPAGRRELEAQQAEVMTWAQEAALESSRGDYYTRREALDKAIARRMAAQATLRQWWQKGELWNSHRIRPIPAAIGRDYPHGDILPDGV